MPARFIKKTLWLFPIALIPPFLFLFMAMIFSGESTEEERMEEFIVANPLDLSQIQGFSRYRSCVGHDYRGPTVYGEEESTPRSLKHYVKVKEELAGKNGVIKAIAPFDAVISNIEERDPERTPENQQIWLTPDTNSLSPRQWQFIFFHIDLNDGLGEGSRVKAGEVIGTAYMTRGAEGKTDNFDIAIKFTKPLSAPAIDIPFSHFSDELLTEYAAYGVTPSEMVIPKDYRDQHPCPTTGDSLDGDVYFPPSSDPIDWVFLEGS